MERHGGDHTTPWTIQTSTRCESVTYERFTAPRGPFGVLVPGQSPSEFDYSPTLVSDLAGAGDRTPRGIVCPSPHA